MRTTVNHNLSSAEVGIMQSLSAFIYSSLMLVLRDEARVIGVAQILATTVDYTVRLFVRLSVCRSYLREA